MNVPPGFYPFWFWNDRLSRDEIRWQVEQMAAQGMRGFFIHSRQGLAQPYLSEAFFEMVDAAIEAAFVAWSPRRIELDTEQLFPGRNALAVKVYTTLIRSFEGQWFDALQHRYRTI